MPCERRDTSYIAKAFEIPFLDIRIAFALCDTALHISHCTGSNGHKSKERIMSYDSNTHIFCGIWDDCCRTFGVFGFCPYSSNINSDHLDLFVASIVEISILAYETKIRCKRHR
jgi:hypothetical protein